MRTQPLPKLTGANFNFNVCKLRFILGLTVKPVVKRATIGVSCKGMMSVDTA